MGLNETLDNVISALEKKNAKFEGRIPYSARLAMGTIGNLNGLESRLPGEYPGEQEAIARINQLIDQLVTELEGLIARNKETGGQTVDEVKQELSTEGERRAQGQMTARRC